MKGQDAKYTSNQMRWRASTHDKRQACDWHTVGRIAFDPTGLGIPWTIVGIIFIAQHAA
ncbi:hypothetical protein PAXRUDRAFT_826734 [Paxillus rubicundulus Ve08.2h10]|uniref:Uncharacterized protein n=1 Tax=Paxillus rubicundulus Ve08.2h10 TaxID=930991 RepID=A0A0D0E9E5_9AGAM|nr:hypothetical protein PAXRUDRAFT_826734 [Paxillus rubicundulus Ve08.2h10]